MYKITYFTLLLFTVCFAKFVKGATYTAINSGNYSNTGTWAGGLKPPSPLGANKILISSGVTVTLDDDIVMNDTASILELNSTGVISSLSANYIAVNAGLIYGGGSINIDSMFTGLGGNLKLYSYLTVNKLEMAGTKLDQHNIQIRVKKEILFSSGVMQFFNGTITLDANAWMVYSGGSLGLGMGTIDVSAGYNTRYLKKNYLMNNTVVDTAYLKNIEIAVGTGFSVTLMNNFNVKGKLSLISGIFNIAGYKLSFDQSSTISTSAGAISGSSTCIMQVNTTIPYFGNIRFGSAIGNLLVKNNTAIRLSSNMDIHYLLELWQTSYIYTDGHVVTILQNGQVSQNLGTGYIVTNMGGQLRADIGANSSRSFYIGSAARYAPVIIHNNTNTIYTAFGVNASDSVLSQGATGTDFTANTSLVKHTWTTFSNESNLDYEMSVSWSPLSEVNGFDRTACLISHYNNGGWDNSSPDVASAVGAQYTIKRNDIHNAGAFTVFDTSSKVPGGITEGQQEKVITLHPNPAKEKVSFQYDFDKPATGTIYDLTGKCLIKFEVKKGMHTIDIANLNMGVYMILLTGEDMNTTIRFVKIN